MKKTIYIILLLSMLLLLFIKVIQNGNVYAGDTEIYDVILFWGQSNMIGYMSDAGERFNNKSQSEVESFSKESKIDKDILYNTTRINYTKVEQQPGTVYEYKYLTNRLEEISAYTKYFGEQLTFNTSTSKLETFSIENWTEVSLQRSEGINMIPEFCRTYYEKTGHKVVAVMCGLGGQKIESFLPKTDPDYVAHEEYGANIFESTYLKYTAAIKYLESNGYTIGNKLWVSCQGESDVLETEYREYKRVFKKVHEYFKSYLGITRGALVQTGFPIGYMYNEVLSINKAQKELIEENDDIISGSSYMYEYYIPDQTTYESTNYINNRYVYELGNKMSYQNAYKAALTSVCVLEDDPDHMWHHTSAALSQVGRETALAFTDVEEISIISQPTKNKYIQNYEKLNLDGGKLSVKLYNGMFKEIDMNDSVVQIKGFDNTKIGKNTISLTVEGKTIKFDVSIIPKSLKSISIKQLPRKSQYIQNTEKIDLTGGIIELKYDDNTLEELYMTSEDIEVTGFDNTKLGEKQLTVEYEGKTATFNVIVVENLKIDFKDYQIKEENSNIYIKNIIPNTTIKELKDAINTNGEIEIFKDLNIINKEDAKLATGMQLRCTYYNIEKVYKIVIKGDVNGDARTDIVDFLSVNKHRLNKAKLVDEYLLASDYNDDGKTDIIDIFGINKFRLNK